jgi:hypothetical protein
VGIGGEHVEIYIAGTAALAIACTSLAYAQQPDRLGGGQRWQPSAEDLRALGEARLAALKAGLIINTEQARNWPALRPIMARACIVRIKSDTNYRRCSPNRSVRKMTGRLGVIAAVIIVGAFIISVFAAELAWILRP